MEKPIGQVAFEAYNAARGGLTHDGKPTPPWDALGDGVRAGWEAAARATVDVTRAELDARGPFLVVEHGNEKDVHVAGSHRVLRLFEVDEGGVSTWVLALNEADARAVMVETYGSVPMEWADDPPEVRVLGLAAAQRAVFHDDDGTERSMAEQCIREPRRGVVACSEV